MVRKSHRKELLAVKFITGKEVLASCWIQAQAPRQKPHEVAILRMQTEVLACALFLGCTFCTNVAVLFHIFINFLVRTRDWITTCICFFEKKLFCGSRKYPYHPPPPTHGRSLEIPRGRGNSKAVISEG